MPMPLRCERCPRETTQRRKRAREEGWSDRFILGLEIWICPDCVKKAEEERSKPGRV
jgi:hypothetical protein